jgi:flagella basal body P-ring formation protein FlgA
MEVSLGQLDSRLHLAPCARIEPYLPVNTQLWGKTRIGLRCLQGSTRWNVFLPVTVKAFGPAWVLRGAVLPGSTLKVQDAMAAEVDWASDASPVLADPALWVGQVAAYPLLAGQPLRQVMLRPAQAFAAGAAIRILTQGAGFSVSSDGQALSNGVVGQLARVRTEAGRVISGVVLDGRTVKIAL